MSCISKLCPVRGANEVRILNGALSFPIDVKSVHDQNVGVNIIRKRGDSEISLLIKSFILI
jgi:hypothetical protein